MMLSYALRVFSESAEPKRNVTDKSLQGADITCKTQRKRTPQLLLRPLLSYVTSQQFVKSLQSYMIEVRSICPCCTTTFKLCFGDIIYKVKTFCFIYFKPKNQGLTAPTVLFIQNETLFFVIASRRNGWIDLAMFVVLRSRFIAKKNGKKQKVVGTSARAWASLNELAIWSGV